MKDQIEVNSLNEISRLLIHLYVVLGQAGFLYLVVVSENMTMYLEKPLEFA